jgi:hypothetical protein
MSREGLLGELQAYRPADARETAMVGELAAFVRAHPDCFERSLSIGHVTASAWVVDESRTVCHDGSLRFGGSHAV